MALTAWNKTDYFDMATGEMAVCYTGYSGRGAYWLTLPMTKPGKSRREQRDWVLTLLSEAVERGDPPGRVEYREPPLSSPSAMF